MEIFLPGSRDPHDRKKNQRRQRQYEEMETSNEELGTVNSELKNKVADLSRVNNDMNNLLAGTGVAAVFVDHQLHIVRFTPGTIELINMIHSDIGRPIGHIVRSTVVSDTHTRYLTGCG